jgi:hypothetical protein
MFLSRRYYCNYAIGLEHATIRDNIVFGCSYGFNKSRYEAVLEACALVRDLEVLDAGDLTGCVYSFC